MWRGMLLLVLVSGVAPKQDPMSVFKQGDYKSAIPLLQTAIQQSPKDAALRASLLSALVYEGRLEEASAADEEGERDFADSPEMLAARGEYSFYIADMAAAENLFRQALKVKDQTARGYYGLSRIEQLACNFRTARLLELRAHELDPDDAAITKRFLGYVPPEKQEPQLSQFIAAHPWFYPDIQKQRSTGEAVNHQLNGQRGFEPEGERKEATLKLIALMRGPNREYGVGLDLRLNNGRSLRLLLDTGASGILLNQKAVDKAGLEHLGSFDSWGVGDAGKRGTFSAVADSCDVEGIAFKHCVVSALEGKHRVDPEDDGLIGADVFRDYLIEIDFQKHVMHLTPLPERPQNAQGYDRAPLEAERGFTPVFRQGDHLFIPTRLNQTNWGLFLIDTGAQLSNVDSTFAAMSTKVRGNSNVRVSGISGQVNKVFEADKATLQFGHFQQDNLGLVSFNLNNLPEHEEFRMSGILGIPVLSMFRLAIDYRNGLVKFDYVFAPKPKKKD